MAEITTEKKKRGRPKKTPEATPKKSDTKQFPLTFKCNSELEMELYNHLISKYYRGAYIKEKLINEMFKERPDLAIKYGANIPQVITAPTPVYIPAPVQVEHEEIEEEPIQVVEDDPTPEPEPEPDPAPPKVKRGLDTLGMF